MFMAFKTEERLYFKHNNQSGNTQNIYTIQLLGIYQHNLERIIILGRSLLELYVYTYCITSTADIMEQKKSNTHILRIL